MKNKWINKRLFANNIFYSMVSIMLVAMLAIIAIGGYLYMFSYRTIYSNFLKQNSQYILSIEKNVSTQQSI